MRCTREGEGDEEGREGGREGRLECGRVENLIACVQKGLPLIEVEGNYLGRTAKARDG